jgi:tetratricopeptide (TPR) repeat protein
MFIALKGKADLMAATALLAVLMGLTLWSYHGVLQSPFHFDDSLFLESPQVSHSGDPSSLVRPSQTRPLAYLTFYWNYRAGGTEPRGYHLANLLLHLVNSFLVLIFVRLLIGKKTDAADDLVRKLLPFAAALIFALHPIQSEAVNYAYQRSTLLAAFFVLLSMIAYLGSEKGRYRGAMRLLALVLWLLAGLSKECAWILPAVLLVYLWTCRPSGETGREAFKRARWIIVVSVVTALAGSVWVYCAIRLSADRTIGLFSPAESFHYLMGEVQVFASYLRLLLWPAGLSIDHAFRVASPWSPYGLYCLLLLLTLLISAVQLRRSKPAAAFLGLMSLLLLAPTSSILPSADLMFEHRLYLPMIAASALLAWGILAIGGFVFKTHRVRLAVCIGIFAVLSSLYAVLSRERTYIWGSNMRLWEDAAGKAPYNSRAHYNLGVAFLSSDTMAARREFARVDCRSPYYAAALYNQGWIEQSSGRYKSAAAYYLASLKTNNGSWRTHQNLGNVFVCLGNIPEAVEQYRETIHINEGYWPAYWSLATLQIRQGDPANALPTLRELISLRPHMLEAEYLYAEALAGTGKFGPAEHALRAIEIGDRSGTYHPRIEKLRRKMKAMEERQRKNGSQTEANPITFAGG